MAKNKNDNDMPSVLAFEKKLVPSDGFMYGTVWNDDIDAMNDNAVPLKLIEKSVRGTISNRLKKAISSDPAKLDAEIQKANLQKVDNCALGIEHDTLKLTFTLKVISGIERPSACNNREFMGSYEAAVREYIEEYRFAELARRYAVNIANARFLWRNRFGAEKIRVRVSVLNEDTNGSNQDSWTFNAREVSIKNFSDANQEINALSGKIASALCGDISFILFKVEAFAKVGNAQDVYPSEELVLSENKDQDKKGKKSKILYSVDGIAGMHSQKIGNAIRTIDTWYPEFDSAGIGPIAIEPYGSVTNLGTAYRKPTDKIDFFNHFDKFACDVSSLNEDAKHYVMAVLVRGGVFGESSKDE